MQLAQRGAEVESVDHIFCECLGKNFGWLSRLNNDNESVSHCSLRNGCSKIVTFSCLVELVEVFK